MCGEGHIAHPTTVRTSLYTSSRGEVVLLGLWNSRPWQAANSSIAVTAEGVVVGTAECTECVVVEIAL